MTFGNIGQEGKQGPDLLSSLQSYRSLSSFQSLDDVQFGVSMCQQPELILCGASAACLRFTVKLCDVSGDSFEILKDEMATWRSFEHLPWSIFPCIHAFSLQGYNQKRHVTSALTVFVPLAYAKKPRLTQKMRSGQ